MLKLQVIGNVGQQAVIRETNGRKVINFSVAHNQAYKNREGIKVEKTTWVNCAKWLNEGQSAKVAEFLTPGTRVFVEGFPEVRAYQTHDNKTAASLDLTVINIELLGSKPATTHATVTQAPQPEQEYIPEIDNQDEPPY